MPSSVTGDQTCRSEEHTSELQSHDNLVCRLLLEKKKPGGRLRPAHLALPEETVVTRATPRPALARHSRAGRSGKSTLPLASRSFLFFFFKKRAPPRSSPFPHPDALPT